MGQRTGASNTTATLRWRIGTTTLGGAIVASLAFGGTTTAPSITINGMMTIHTTAPAGTVNGGEQAQYGAVAPTTNANLGLQAVNTTVNNYVEVTIQSGNANNIYTLHSIVLEKLR